jgi:hypothetical protein
MVSVTRMDGQKAAKASLARQRRTVKLLEIEAFRLEPRDVRTLDFA